MGKKHRAIFEAIQSKPDRKGINWDEFILLLEYLGATMKTSGGSAVGVRLHGEYAVFHKPHPGHQIYPSDLKRIQRFFESAGVTQVE